MDHFEHRDGQLWCERVPLAPLADAVGTPVFDVTNTHLFAAPTVAFPNLFPDHFPRVAHPLPYAQEFAKRNNA